MAYAKPIRPGRAARRRAVAAAKLAGCTCKPDVEIVRWDSDQVQHVQARHDAGCPAVNAGRQVAVGLPGAAR